jgi:S-adenosylmethionine decarboxylase
MAKGKHLIVDCTEVPMEICLDDKMLMEVMVEAAVAAKANVISTSRYRFGHNSPPGCTVFIMLDESHISAHTYAQEGKVAIDVFTCGERVNIEELLATIINKLKVEHYNIRALDRFY